MNINAHTPLNGAALVDSQDRAAISCGLDGSTWTLVWSTHLNPSRPSINARRNGLIGTVATSPEYAGDVDFVPGSDFADAFAVVGPVSLSGPALVDWLVDRMLTLRDIAPQVRELRNTLLDAAALCRRGEMTPAACAEVFERTARLVVLHGRRQT